MRRQVEAASDMADRCKALVFMAVFLSAIVLAGLISTGTAFADDGHHDRDRRPSRVAYGPPELKVEIKDRVGKDGRSDGYDGREFSWRITVENDGNSAAGPFYVHYVINQAPALVYPLYVPSLGAGKSVSFNVDLGPCVSWNNIWVSVDPFHQVPEANDFNNERYAQSNACFERQHRRDDDGWDWLDDLLR